MHINPIPKKRTPLRSSIIKVHRAKEHFNNFNAEIKAFKGRDTHTVFADEETQPATKFYRVRITEPVPILWGAHIGDIVHNLVGALDSLATSMVVAAGHTSENVMQETYFPIHWSEGQLSKGKAANFFARVGPDVEKAVRALEPYRGGKGDALWRLHRLDIIDKHRTIVAAAMEISNITFEIPVDPAVGNIPDRIIDRPRPPFPLKDGDIIFQTDFFEEHFYAKAKFSFGIAFDETQVFDRQPVLPTLRQLIELVDGIIKLFAGKFFKP